MLALGRCGLKWSLMTQRRYDHYSENKIQEEVITIEIWGEYGFIKRKEGQMTIENRLGVTPKLWRAQLHQFKKR